MIQTHEVIGYLAGTGTTISFFPQMIRVIRTGSTEDLSVFMFLIHSTGVTLWIIYGSMIANYIIISFNVITMVFNLTILMYFIKNYKLRGHTSPQKTIEDSNV